MARLDLCVVIGTRPEAIKLMPVIMAARARSEDIRVSIVRTGQHRDMVDMLLKEFDLVADFNLDVMLHGQDLAHVLSASVRGLSDHFARERPHWVLVQGDTTTTFAGALAAFYQGLPVGHVEAGLRTGSLLRPFPEEANRAMTARLAELHFAPTERARENLITEGIDDRRIFVTGNTGIDALTRCRAEPVDSAAQPVGRYLLVTAHRRETQGAALVRICQAVSTLLDRHPDLTAWIPMHPNPSVRATISECLGRDARARLTDPLGYREFSSALVAAALVLTDSGGVQEECAALGKPVLVLRDETERSEGVEAGLSVVVGTDPRRIADVATRLLEDPTAYQAMARPSAIYGSGDASTKILDAVIDAQRARSRLSS